jgi:hypothetical protein
MEVTGAVGCSARVFPKLLMHALIMTYASWLIVTCRILGVDPGIHGGLAIIGFIDGEAPKLIDCIDIPTIGIKAKERVDVLAIREWIEAQQPDTP